MPYQQKQGEPSRHLILETKGFDPLVEVKAQAALRWVNAVNADGSYGQWHYAVARKPEEVRKRIEEIALAAQNGANRQARTLNEQTRGRAFLP